MDRLVAANIFGTFRVHRGDDDLRPHGRKTRALLAYVIAAERRSVPRARLADLLWSDRGDEQARNSLRQALSELRSSRLGDAITVSRTDVAITPDRWQIDTREIEACAVGGDCHGLGLILAGIDGDYLDDLDGLSPAYDDWLHTQRAHQHDWLFGVALGCVAALDATSSETARSLLAELARLDPLNEAVVRTRLRLDHVAGDVAAVQRHYRRLSDDLSRELNVAPSRETQELLLSLVGARDGGAVRQAEPSPRAKPVLGRRTPPVVTLAPFAGDGPVAEIGAIVTDAICTALSRGTEFRVLPLATGDAATPDTAAQHAVAAFALRGSVRLVRDTTVVTAHVVDSGTGFVVWSEQLETTMPDREWIGTVVERIVAAVGSAIEHDAGGYRRDLRPIGDEVADLYSEGKRIVRHGRSLKAVKEGIALFDRAIELDPHHVGAHLRLAQLYNTDCHYLIAGHDYRAMRARALTLAMTAAEIEPTSVRVQLRLAWCRLREGDWTRAASLFRAAERAMGHDPNAMNECGFGLAQLGELDAARDLIQRAFKLNPFAPAEYHADFAVLQTLAGEHDLAEAHFDVCGEQRLFWQVIRLGNLQKIERQSPRLRALQQRFVASFLEIWARPTTPVLADVLSWTAAVFCFRRSEHCQLIADAVTAAWQGHAPGAADNSWSAADAAAAGTPGADLSAGRRAGGHQAA